MAQARVDLEAAALHFARRSGIDAPELVARDESGDTGDVPAVLMTRVLGLVVLRPTCLEDWLEELARAWLERHPRGATSPAVGCLPGQRRDAAVGLPYPTRQRILRRAATPVGAPARPLGVHQFERLA